MVIIQAFKTWRHFLQGTPHPVEVITDHQNLTYFKTAQKLNTRQARWHAFLNEFNFVLKHHPGKTLTQADALSRRTGYEGGENDNKNVTMLPESLFLIKAVNVELQQRIRDYKARDGKIFVDRVNST